MLKNFETLSLFPKFTLLGLALVLAAGFIWICGWDAKRRLRQFYIVDAKDRANVFDTFRKTTAQVIGAATVVILFAYTFTKDNLTYEQARSTSAASTYAEGVKLLKESDATVKAAAIYLVEKVGASDSTYRDPITRTLVSFIKQKPPADRSRAAEPVQPDVKAAIYVLGRTAPISDNDKFSLNLDGASLAGADFSYLTGFRERRLQGADLRVANFEQADLSAARLSGSEMNDSAAFGPDFNDNIPKRNTWYYEKYWYAAQFDCADLTRTLLDGAGLTGALFGRADVNEANLDRANLSRADFSQARNLDKTYFGDACADEAPVFPAGFTCQLRKCTAPQGGPAAQCKYARNMSQPSPEKTVEACLANISNPRKPKG